MGGEGGPVVVDAPLSKKEAKAERRRLRALARGPSAAEVAKESRGVALVSVTTAAVIESDSEEEEGAASGVHHQAAPPPPPTPPPIPCRLQLANACWMGCLVTRCGGGVSGRWWPRSRCPWECPQGGVQRTLCVQWSRRLPAAATATTTKPEAKSGGGGGLRRWEWRRWGQGPWCRAQAHQCPVLCRGRRWVAGLFFVCPMHPDHCLDQGSLG